MRVLRAPLSLILLERRNGTWYRRDWAIVRRLLRLAVLAIERTKTDEARCV